ncbi:hypothetical protein HKCCE2091_04040 [Rhodobacterales bacterium HKCCE2091]|nr:hypothetical protein [Rhodobacterales bacterium HKCCE2091]
MDGQGFTLATRQGGTILLRDAVLTLPGDGTLGLGGDRVVPLAELRGIRLWTEKGDQTRPVGRAELTFLHGPPVVVTGATPMGASDAARGKRYRAFIEALHEALPQGARVEFRRGFRGGSPARGWIGFGIAAALDIALLVLFLGNVREDSGPLVRPVAVIFAVAGLIGAAGFGQAMAGRGYDPRAIPAELLP